MIRRTPRSTRTDKLFPYTNALPIWQEDQLRRLTHSFSNRSRVSTFREFRTAEKAAELAPAFNHVAHAPVSLARSEEHTSELQSLMRISYAVFCLNKKNITYISLVLTPIHSIHYTSTSQHTFT